MKERPQNKNLSADYRFKKGESGNKNGRPPLLLTTILKELSAQGYKRVSKANIAEAYDILLGLDEDKIKELILKKETPMILRIVGKQMLSSKGHEMLEKMLDRGHGKATQPVDNKISLDKEQVFKIGGQTITFT